MKKIFTLLTAALFTANAIAIGDDNIVKYDFEHYKLVDVEDSELKYYAWSELNADGSETDVWASGNAAFAIAASMLSETGPEVFPTVAVADGYDGACVKLETKSTGALGAMFGMPIAAGNLFMGFFDTENAVMDAMHATQFGKPFDRKPLKFTGYYKYKAGAELKDGTGNVIEGKTDQGRIYSVLYRNKDSEGNPVVLYGDDVFTSPQIVAIADAGEIKDVDDWTRFEVEYNYGDNTIDEETLAAQGYSLTVVFTSSVEGAAFTGAAGSTLYVDKVAIECESENKDMVFTDNLQVTLSGTPLAPQQASIYVTEQADGKYTLSLKNFTLSMPDGDMNVGNIVIKDVEGADDNGTLTLTSVQNITIENGDDPNIAFWSGPYLGPVPVDLTAKITGDKLYAVINIAFSGMDINVVFGSDPTGIESAKTGVEGNAIEGIYTMNGAKVTTMQPGQVYIIKYANGKTVKSIRK